MNLEFMLEGNVRGIDKKLWEVNSWKKNKTKKPNNVES